MHLRTYNEQTDFTYIAKWIRDERSHALWCANLLSYPLTKDGLRNYLIEQNVRLYIEASHEMLQDEMKYDAAYVYTDEHDRPLGFFVYTVNEQERAGFLRFIMVDDTLRGKGYGTDMLRELQRFAYEKTGVSSVRLIVFDVNTAARKCYEKAGFTVMENMPDAFPYRDEMWGRCMMFSVPCSIMPEE